MRFMRIESVLQTKNRSELTKKRFSVALSGTSETVIVSILKFELKCFYYTVSHPKY